MTGILTDAELVSRALTGSDAAFSRLVERHQAAVRGFLRRALGGGWAEADDGTGRRWGEACRAP